MSRLAVAEEGLVVDPRLQALEVEPARGLVATVVIAIERHLVESRVVIGIPSMSGLPELVRVIVGVAVVLLEPINSMLILRIRGLSPRSTRLSQTGPRVYKPPNTPGIHPLAYARHPAARRTVRGIIAAY